MRDELGRRPTASELFARDILPRTLSQSAGSWFAFVESEGDLKPEETAARGMFDAWLKTLETTVLNKSYKMVVLRVMLDEGWMFKLVDLQELSKRCRRFMQSHPILRRDLEGDGHAIDHQHADDQEWATWWIKWPIGRWLTVQNGSTWFKQIEESFRFTIECPDELRPTLEQLTEELVDWRLANYSKTHRLVVSNTEEISFEAKVSHSSGNPILFLPDKTKQPSRPMGPVNVKLPDNSDWEFKFVKVACNVAKPLGGTQNELGQLMRNWFGSNAGLPGTDFKVLFENKQGQWHARPATAIQVEARNRTEDSAPQLEKSFDIEDQVQLSSQYRTHVPVYDLTAAAGGWGEEGVPEEAGWIRIDGRKLSRGMFVAQVVGHSMEPKIPSGSLCLFAPCPAGSRQNRLLLVQVNTHTDPEDGGRYTVKRYFSKKQSTDDGWQHETIELQPLNPEYKPIPIDPEQATDIRVIGEFICVIAGNR